MGVSFAIVYAAGLPETPIYLAAVPGTGVTGTIRPDATGAPIYLTAPGLFLNSTAYTAPLPGQWVMLAAIRSSARRNST